MVKKTKAQQTRDEMSAILFFVFIGFCIGFVVGHHWETDTIEEDYQELCLKV